MLPLYNEVGKVQAPGPKDPAYAPGPKVGQAGPRDPAYAPGPEAPARVEELLP